MTTLMHTHEANVLYDRLTAHGQDVTIEQVDQAVQSASESFRDNEGHWPNYSNSFEMDYIEYRAVEFLDIDHDLVGM